MEDGPMVGGPGEDGPGEGRSALLPGLARRLRADRLPLARALNPTARLVPRFAAELRAQDDDGTGFALREHASLIDYMANWIERGNPVFRVLYPGERSRMAYDPGHDAAMRAATIRALVESDAASSGRVGHARLDPRSASRRRGPPKPVVDCAMAARDPSDGHCKEGSGIRFGCT